MHRHVALAVVLSLAAQVAHAQAMPIRSRVVGADVVIESADPLGTCGGELIRSVYSDPSDILPGTILGSGLTCPVTVPGDALLTGAEEAFFYVLRDPATLRSGAAFRQELHLDVRALPSGVPTANEYFVSVPLIQSFEDLANSSATESNKCVGDPGGPSAPDGLINADDVICAWWTSRPSGQGSFLIARRDEPTAAYLDRSGWWDAATSSIVFAGPWTAPLGSEDEGWVVFVDGAVGTQNRFVVTGGHDSTTTGRVISAATDTQFLVNEPYHAMYQRASEILCGLEGVDSIDVDGDGWVDYCHRGIFDESHDVTLVTYDNDIDGSPGDGTYVSLTVSMSPLTRRIVFSGTNFELKPGRACLAFITPSQLPRTFLAPHF